MAYIKLGLRDAMAISVVSVAVLIQIEKCRKALIAFGAVAPKPMRAYETEELFINQEITKELIESCCGRVKKEVSPITDIRASAEYRQEMCSVLLRKVLRPFKSREKN